VRCTSLALWLLILGRMSRRNAGQAGGSAGRAIRCRRRWPQRARRVRGLGSKLGAGGGGGEGSLIGPGHTPAGYTNWHRTGLIFGDSLVGIQAGTDEL
jgi:hypothetical protein